MAEAAKFIESLAVFAMKVLTWIVDHPVRVLVMCFMLAALAAYGARDIKASSDYRYFFSDDNPYLKAFTELGEVYSSPDNVLIVVHAKEGSIFTPEGLKALAEMTDAAWQLPYAARVDSVINYQHIQAVGDDLEVTPLIDDPFSLTAEEASRVREIALTDTPLVNTLLSPDGRTAGIIANVQVPEGDQEALERLVGHGRDLRDDFAARYPDLKLVMSGTTMMSVAFMEFARQDMARLTPIVLGVIIVFCAFLLRSVMATIAAFAVVGLSTIGALGVAGWWGVTLSVGTGIVPAVILTIGVADSIHILVIQLQEMRKGKSKREALLESLRLNLQPVTLTSLTTAIGFLCLNFSDSPPFWDLGNVAAVGCVITLFMSLTLLPALVMLLPMRTPKVLDRQNRIMETLADFVIAHRVRVLTACILFTFGMGALVPRIVINDEFLEYLSDRTELKQSVDFANRNLTSFMQIQYSLPSGGTGEITDTKYIATLDAFADWYRQQPGVTYVASVSTLFKRLNQSMHSGDPAYDKVPDRQDLAAQYLLLYEMSLPSGLDLNSQIDIDRSATRFVVTIEPLPTKDMTSLIERADDWLAQNAPDMERPVPVGQALMFAFIGESNIEGMIRGTGFAILLISACLGLALRNWKLGVLSILPNLAPPLIAFGIFSLFRDSVGFWAAFVAVIALGLIVDATVHFISKYQRARLELKSSPEDAVRYAFATVGPALWVCTAILILGFAILLTSPFQLMAMMGIVVALTIAIALVLDFLMLPALLLTLDRWAGVAGPKAKMPPLVAQGEAAASAD